MTERVCEVRLSLLLAVAFSIEFSVKLSVVGVWCLFASSIPPFLRLKERRRRGGSARGAAMVT